MFGNSEKTQVQEYRVQEGQWQEIKEWVGVDCERHGSWSVDSVSRLWWGTFCLLLSTSVMFSWRRTCPVLSPYPFHTPRRNCVHRGGWIWGWNWICPVPLFHRYSQEHHPSKAIGQCLGRKACLIQGWSIRKAICPGSKVTSVNRQYHQWSWHFYDLQTVLSPVLSLTVVFCSKRRVYVWAFLKLQHTCEVGIVVSKDIFVVISQT